MQQHHHWPHKSSAPHSGRACPLCTHSTKQCYLLDRSFRVDLIVDGHSIAQALTARGDTLLDGEVIAGTQPPPASAPAGYTPPQRDALLVFDALCVNGEVCATKNTTERLRAVGRGVVQPCRALEQKAPQPVPDCLWLFVGAFVACSHTPPSSSS